jgi:hypothetical protein
VRYELVNWWVKSPNQKFTNSPTDLAEIIPFEPDTVYAVVGKSKCGATLHIIPEAKTN